MIKRLLFLTVITLGLAWQLYPPSPRPASIPASEFSAERAMKYVEAIAQKPHPLGSSENAKVRQYLLDELRSMGLEPEVQMVAVSNGGGRDQLNTVYNIVGRLRGTGSSRTVMLAAHYDSAPGSPGAGDDAAGVATLLETLRALRAGDPLRNDVILVITDGEESGLVGAKAFVDGHPWVKDAGVVLNFEARGNTGPVIMFETSEDNGWLIQQFAQAAPYPRAYSFIYDLYKKMPNDTDLTEFKRAGIAGLNFAMADGWATYHGPQDNAAALDRGSLQHMGSYAQSLTRHFANLDLDNPRDANQVFFTAAGLLVYYPQSWSVPLAVLAALAFAGVTALGVRRKRLSIKTGLGVLVFVLNAVIAGVLGFVAVRALTGVFHESAMAPTHDSRLYAAGFAALALVSTAIVYRWLRSKIGVANLVVGAGAGWLCLAMATALAVPRGSYLFAWPLLFSLLALGLTFAAAPAGGVSQWTGLLPAVASLMLFVPAIWVLLLVLPVAMYWAAAAMAAVVWGLLVPQLGSS